MTILNTVITDFSVGDDVIVDRQFPVAEATTVTTAWLMVKRRYDLADSDAIIAKTITTVEDVDQGIISNDGTVDSEAIVRFYINADETVELTPYSEYVYSIKVLFNTGKVYTEELGKIIAYPAVKLGNT